MSHNRRECSIFLLLSYFTVSAMLPKEWVHSALQQTNLWGLYICTTRNILQNHTFINLWSQCLKQLSECANQNIHSMRRSLFIKNYVPEKIQDKYMPKGKESIKWDNIEMMNPQKLGPFQLLPVTTTPQWKDITE